MDYISAREDLLPMEKVEVVKKYLRKRFGGDEFKFLAVYAAPSVRYARLAQRAQRSLTLLQAQERDYSQLTTLNQGGPIALADFTVHNESALTQLYQELDNVLKKVNDAR